MRYNQSNSFRFSYVDLAGNTYTRRVNAALNNITLDEEGGSLATKQTPSHSVPQNSVMFGEARLPGGRHRAF
jgi:hypothetical protein